MTGQGSWVWELNNSRIHSNSRALAWEGAGVLTCVLCLYVPGMSSPLTGRWLVLSLHWCLFLFLIVSDDLASLLLCFLIIYSTSSPLIKHLTATSHRKLPASCFLLSSPQFRQGSDWPSGTSFLHRASVVRSWPISGFTSFGQLLTKVQTAVAVGGMRSAEAVKDKNVAA